MAVFVWLRRVVLRACCGVAEKHIVVFSVDYVKSTMQRRGVSVG